MLILRETSITLTELDTLKRENPERYWEFYFWLLIEKQEQAKNIANRKDHAKDTGSKDVGTIGELNKPQYSEIIKKEDIESGKYKLPQ